MRDQHGRRWGCSFDHKSNAPVGHWDSPVAPIVPPSHFLRLSKDPDRPNELTVDYDAIIKELREAASQWNKDAEAAMSRRHGEKYKPGMPLDSDVGEALGPRPDPIEPWIAAKQGNKYVLGLTQVVDVRLAPFLKLKGAEPDEPDFSDDPDFTDLDDQYDNPPTKPRRGQAAIPAGGFEAKPKTDWHSFLKEQMSAGPTMKHASERS